MSLLIAIMTSFMLHANPHTDCFDYGLRATGQLELALNECGTKLTGIELMRKRLQAGPVMYTQRAFKALRKLDSQVDGLESNDCHNSVKTLYMNELRPQIVRSIDICSL